MRKHDDSLDILSHLRGTVAVAPIPIIEEITVAAPFECKHMVWHRPSKVRPDYTIRRTCSELQQ